MNNTLANCIQAAWRLVQNPNIEEQEKFRRLKILFIQASGVGYEAALSEIGKYGGRVSPVFDLLKAELDKIRSNDLSFGVNDEKLP